LWGIKFTSHPFGENIFSSRSQENRSEGQEQEAVRDDLKAMRAGYANPGYSEGVDLKVDDLHDQSMA